MEYPLNFPIVAATALVPLVVGFLWYNPKTFANAWMKSAGITPEHGKGANMPLIFGLTLLFGVMASIVLSGIAVHQASFYALLQPEGGVTLPGNEEDYKMIMEKYGKSFRTFHHGVIHGIMTSLFLVLPIIGTNALYERKGFKYIAINVGYWMVTLAIMGGIIARYA